MNLKNSRDSIFILILITFALAIFSLVFVYSSSSVVGLKMFKNDAHFVKRQVISYLIGFTGMFILSNVNYFVYKKYKNAIFFLGLFILIIVLIPGIGSKINGERRWIRLGFMSIQPSEFAKPLFILYFSTFLEKCKKMRFKDFEILIPGLILIGSYVIPIVLTDIGTAFHLLVIATTMLYLADISVKTISIYISSAVTFVMLLIVTNERKMVRIKHFINSISQSFKGEMGYSYQLKQSLIGIGKGGLIGSSIGNGSQKYFYLPYLHADFIFSIVSEEGGFLLASLLIAFYILILMVGVNATVNCDNIFGKYVTFGITISIVSQAILNIMVATGLIPATGIPLPFISHGGSSVMALLFSVGIIINVLKNNEVTI